MTLLDKMILDSYKHDVADVLNALSTSRDGLSSNEVKKRLKTHGHNLIKTKKELTSLKIFLYQFKNIMIYMLIVAFIVSFLINELTDAVVILFILLLNAVLGFIQEYKAEKAMEALESLAAPKAVVFRDGKEMVVWGRDLVPGDIVLLNTGDRVPANIRLIEGHNLKIDQAHLTGESVPVTKSEEKILKELALADRSNIAYMGSLVTYGKGFGVVTATGMQTEIGKIAHSVQAKPRETTPLQKEISGLGKWLSISVVIAISMLFMLGLLFNKDATEMFLTAVSLAVSAVPEGLPAVITVTLAIGMQRMGRRNAVVRKLSAVQTLGNVTVICTDKTGTLTKNEMTVTKIYDGAEEYDVTGAGYEPKGDFKLNNKVVSVNELELLFKTGVLCNNAYFGKSDDSWNVIGDPTEGSLLVLAAKAGVWHDEIKSVYSELSELSFDSVRKRMSVVYKSKSGVEAFSKGAPDTMLNLCSKIMVNGKIKKLTAEKRKEILKKNQEWASHALRVLAVAYRKLPSSIKKFEQTRVEKDLVFLGLVGMIDPPRAEAGQSINLCREAGIKVKMITGDHALTAVAIAKQLGLFIDGAVAVSGEELDKMSDKDFTKTVMAARIFARVSPEHKLRIIEELKRQGEIVAVTGDGINDAPALKTAHIGIAMGIKGTDVSKEASEMVLTDDNFSTIVNAVEEGRGIFDNIKKFIKFLLSANADTIAVVTASLLVGLPLPYLPIHILWMNLVTDGLPALALSVDSKSPDLMSRKPRNPKKSLVRELALFIIIAGVIDAISSITLFIIALNFEGYFITGSALALSKARTMAISSAIIYELFFVFNCRHDKKSVWSKSFRENFLSNKKLTIAVIASLILQLLFIYLPLFQFLFKTVSLSIIELGLVFLFASGGLFILPRFFHKELNWFAKEKV